MPEAPLEDVGFGLAPAGDGWFVLNARDAVWLQLDVRGSRCDFETEERSFPQLGIGLHVLEPGVPAGLYHAESQPVRDRNETGVGGAPLDAGAAEQL